MRAIVLAGGTGARLMPYTATLPKPLLPLGGTHALLEVTLGQLARAGVERATLAIGHMAELVSAYFGDGARVGLALDYVVEAEPRGTAGAIAAIADLPEHFLALNGDVLADVDHRALFEAHLAAGDDLTLACRAHPTEVPYGVVECDAAGRVTRFIEKPRLTHRINMGVYALARRAFAHVTPGARLGMDELVHATLARGARVGGFAHDGVWLDVGTPDDYARANAQWPTLATRLLA